MYPNLMLKGEGGIRNLPGRQQEDEPKAENGLSACEISLPAVTYSSSAEENINISLYFSTPGLNPCECREQQGYKLWLLSDHKKQCFLMP